MKRYQFEQLDSLQIRQERDVVVFIRAEWCAYCKMMENSTFKNEKVVQKLNNNFYFVELDGEEKREIVFAGNTFRFKPTGPNIGVNELAEALGTIDGQIAYPSLVVLNLKNEITFQYASFLKADELTVVLKRLSKK